MRKVVVAETSLNDLKQRSPSPPKHAASNILYITNLVRPFTVVQLRDLLARTGNIVPEKGFWIDGIKSRCYVKVSAWSAMIVSPLRITFAEKSVSGHFRPY